jgi:hypothetical protein
MSSARTHRVFYATLPDGKRVHRVAAAEYTHAVATRIDVLWTLQTLSTSLKQAQRRAQQWRNQMLTRLRCTKDCEARVVPLTCDDLPAGGAVRVTLPSGTGGR